MCARSVLLQVCHLVLVAGNGYISEGEKTDFQRTSHLDQLSLSVQQSVSARWLRPPPPGRFRDMSYLGYHRLEHALPPTPLPNRFPLVPTLPPVKESSKGKPGFVSESVAGGGAPGNNGNPNGTEAKKEQEAVTGSKGGGSILNLEVAKTNTNGRRGQTPVKDGSIPTKKEVSGDTGTHSRRGGVPGKDGSIPTKKEHLEVSESAHEPSYAAPPGYPSGRVRIQVYRGPTKKVGYKYFAPWGYYVSQPSDDKPLGHGYH